MRTQRGHLIFWRVFGGRLVARLVQFSELLGMDCMRDGRLKDGDARPRGFLLSLFWQWCWSKGEPPLAATTAAWACLQSVKDPPPRRRVVEGPHRQGSHVEGTPQCGLNASLGRVFVLRTLLNAVLALRTLLNPVEVVCPGGSSKR